jgi:GTP cyclohydrolase I
MEKLIREILVQLGEDPDREGLVRTPLRVEKALKFLTGGQDMDVESVVNGAIFEEGSDEMIVCRDIDFYSLCEHHMLPFFGRAHLAYVPDGRILGLSKLARIVDVFARRLQVQERLTTQVADAVGTVLQPKGVGVVIEARHLCMMMRGVQKQNTVMTTSSMRGIFKKDPRTRTEFMSLLSS